jgi:DeoR family transcriptional regulator, fructose operon transcriptional repressor
MLPDERRYALVNLLRQQDNGAASVAQLAELFCVSKMTIRRDLAWLEARSRIQRVHGGAIAITNDESEKSFIERTVEHSRQKASIGAVAASLIEDGDRIILDAGTTTREVARHLATRRDLTVITNALPVAQELARIPGVHVIILGGALKPEELCTVGPMVTRELARLSVDKLFLSAAGFDPRKGLTDPDIQEADVKEAMIMAADRVFLVADSSKWGQVALARIAPLHTVEALITDEELAADARAVLETAGVGVITPRTPLSTS